MTCRLLNVLNKVLKICRAGQADCPGGASGNTTGTEHNAVIRAGYGHFGPFGTDLLAGGKNSRPAEDLTIAATVA